MNASPRSGPLRVLHTDDGLPVPFYVIPFDADGACTGPETLDDLVKAAADATDVFVFAHGWNNDWPTAIDRYDAFITGYAEARNSWWNPVPRPYRPVLAGVFWPSTALVFGSEKGPDIAGGPDDVDALADAVAAPERLRELTTQGPLDEESQRELTEILAPALTGDDELGAAPPTPDDLLAAWRAMTAQAGAQPAEPGGFIDDDTPRSALNPGGTTTHGAGFQPDVRPDPARPAVGQAGFKADREPQTAGIGFLDPRGLVRLATVWLMKDRAGRVGARGVAGMLRRLVEAGAESRVHLVGHSYGAKVMLSALCNGAAPVREVESVLLLQPAVSGLCFAADFDGRGTPGGYRGALTRTRQPVITTYSGHDFPLTKLFHWAVRRKSDLGEVRIAGAPSPYAALGGYGPHGTRAGEVAWVDALAPDQRYTVTPGGPRVLAVRGDPVISGHGDVTGPATAWALLCQVMG